MGMRQISPHPHMQQDLRRERFYCARGHGKMSLKTRLTLTIYYNTLDGLDLHAHFRQQRQSLQISRLTDVDQLVVLFVATRFYFLRCFLLHGFLTRQPRSLS